MSDGRYEAEQRQILDDKYLHMCQVAEDSARELMDRDKMLFKSRGKEKELKERNRKLTLWLKEIAEIIYMQMPLRHQDAWVQYMMTMGMYTPYDDEERAAHNIDTDDIKIVSAKK